MPFLKIENPVRNIPSVELMRMLGASSSRGNSERIGQFGSGFPYSLALLARHGLLERTKICLGKDVYTFELEPHTITDASGHRHVQNEIRMKKQNGASWDLNISTEFGAIDWRDIRLAIREFVSNAIDGVYDFGGNPSKDVVIDTTIPDEGRMTRAADGLIRIYIPMNDAIQTYVDDLHKHFRCLAAAYDPNRSVILNTDGGPARIYRKGVLVGTFGRRSLFHYNIKDVHLNESRILDEYTARDACARAIAKSESPNIISKFLSYKLNSSSDEFFESKLYVSEMNPERISFENEQQEERCKRAFNDAVRMAVGSRVVAESKVAAKILESKGIEPVIVESGLGDVLRSYGARTADDVLNRDELAGQIISEATPEVISLVDYVWGVLVKYELTLNKDKPGVKCFTQHIQEGSMSGYADIYRPGDDNIYVRRDHSDGVNSYSMNVVLHELDHYITRADDCTHEFADFLCKVAVALMMEGWQKNS